MEVGSAFSDFKDVEAALEKLKKEQCHPLRVYNSQSAADYNKKRANTENSLHQLTQSNYTSLTTACDVCTTVICSRVEVKAYVPIRVPPPKVVRQMLP